MGISRKLAVLAPSFLLAGICAAFIISGGNFQIVISGFSSLFSSPQPSGGNFSVQSSAGRSVGALQLSGGNFSITSDVSGAQSAYLKTDLSEAIVFPNPYKPGSGGAFDAAGITFRNLTQKATIRIFNIAGELVKTIEVNDPAGEAKWDVRNDSGEKVASGVYIYFAFNPDNPSQKAKGKLSIIK